MIEFIRLDHIQLCIPSGQEEEARVFYGEILGLKEIAKPEALIKNGGLWYELGAIQLHIGTENTPLYSSKRHPAFEVNNIIEVKDYLTSKSVKIKEDEPIPNVERFSFFDPWGNRIELLEKINLVSEEIQNFWNRFILKYPEYKLHSIPVVDHFCNDKINADLCADLVKNEIKRASCGLKILWELDSEFFPKVGELSIITDWDKTPICIIKTTNTYFKKFAEIDTNWAKSEGEGDQSLENWRITHQKYFQRQLDKLGLIFTDQVELFCEEFELIYSA